MLRRAALLPPARQPGYRLPGAMLLVVACGIVVFVAMSTAGRVLVQLEHRSVLAQVEAWAGPLLADLAAVPEAGREAWLGTLPQRPTMLRMLRVLPAAAAPAAPVLQLWPSQAEILLPLWRNGNAVGALRLVLDRPQESAHFAAALADTRLCILLAVLPGAVLIPLLLGRRRPLPAPRPTPAPESASRAEFICAIDHSLSLMPDDTAVILLEISGTGALEGLDGAVVEGLLRAALGRLEGAARANDVLARLGPYRFGLLVDCDAAAEVPTRIAERLVRALAMPYAVGGHAIMCGAHAGIARAGAAPVSGTLLLAQAEVALRAAAAGGSGTCLSFAPALGTELADRRGLEGALREAVANEAFELHYQPIFAAHGRALLGFEALLRWQQPGGGPVSPTDFVPILEQTGLILPVGAWVLQTACREAAAWPGQVGISVNLSPAQFHRDDLVATVRDALAESGLSPARLTLEITEGLLLDHTDSVLETLARLRGIGCSIALDDFGSGYSSLAYLWRFHFDTLKIDRAFVRALGPNGKAMAIIQTIIGLGRTLDLRITAEGVETEEQFAVISTLGCDAVQGFLLGLPMPAEQARTLTSPNPAVSVAAE